MTTIILFPATPEQLVALYNWHLEQWRGDNDIKHVLAAQDIQARLRAARDHQEHEPV